MTTKAQQMGERIGKAIARDVIADKLPSEWPGLSDQDGDQLTDAGIEPGTEEWDEAEYAAMHAYMVLIGERDSLADQHMEHDANRSDRWIG